MDTNEQKIIAKFKSLQPDTHFSASFSARLRSELLRTELPTKPLASPYSSLFTTKILYGVIGSALTILIVVPVTFMAARKEAPSPIVLDPFSVAQVKDASTDQAPKQQISNKGTNAFGKLALIPATTTSAAVSTPATAAPLAISPLATSTSSRLFSYKGEAVGLSDTEAKVYKRTEGIDYSIRIEFDQASVATTTSDTASTTNSLDSAGLIAIADAFVKQHSIDMSVYTDPVAKDLTTVIYPLQIDSKQVYESNGTPFGLVVSINPAAKKVVNVTNLTSQTYDSSLYPLETDFNLVTSIATSSLNKGVDASSTRTASLLTPKQVLMHYWVHDEKTNTDSELFIPALSYPTKFDEKAQAQSRTTVVPLVKDFLSKWKPFTKS